MLKGTELEQELFNELVGESIASSDIVALLDRDDVSSRHKAYLVLYTDFLDIVEQKAIVKSMVSYVLNSLSKECNAVTALANDGLSLFASVNEEQDDRMVRIEKDFINVTVLLGDKDFVGKDRMLACAIFYGLRPFLKAVDRSSSDEESWRKAAALSVDHVARADSGKYLYEDAVPFSHSFGDEYEKVLSKILLNICYKVLGLYGSDDVKKFEEMSLF
jgi:hypothetical protein